MQNILVAILLISMLCTFFSILAGMFVMARGGEVSQKYGNMLMRIRVFAQAIALASFILLVMTKIA